MKKKLLILIISLTILILLCGIVIFAVNKLKEKECLVGNNASLKEKKEENSYPVFYGKVLDNLGIFEQVGWVKEVPGHIQITIEPEENEEIRKSADKIVAYINEDNGNFYSPGTRVKVTYTGYIQETYPAQIDCISVEEVENKAVNMYKKILEDLIKQDSALNENAKFIAIDFEKFSTNYKDRYEEDKNYRRNLSPNEKQAIIDFCKQYNENVIEANFEKLKEQGYFNEETKSLDGILISVEQIETIKEDKAVIRISKYRSALGAIMPKYELNLINDYYWDLKVLDTIIS